MTSLKKIMKTAILIVARQSVFIPLIARFVAQKLVDFDLVQADRAGANRNILALNAIRYGQDLKRINGQGEFRVKTLDPDIQNWINALFIGGLTGERVKRLGARVFLKSNAPENQRVVAKQEAYLQKLIRRICKCSDVEAIVTCTFYYAQDHVWMSAAEEAGVPFVVLHKECMKDESIIPEMTKQYATGEIYFRFKGTRMTVYNDNEKKCQVDSGIVSEDKVVVTGCPRTDVLFKRRLEAGFPDPGKCVTFFSFRHLIGGLRDPELKTGFSVDGSNGAVRLFAESHAAFAQTAILHPDWEFVIKPKWLKNWAPFIEKTILEEIGVDIADISNLRVDVSEPAQSLIDRSKVVVGLNSTAVIEARVAGRDVVIPVFEEAEGRHRDRIYFRKYFDTDFMVARSGAHQQELIEKAMLSVTPVLNNQDDRIFREFFGFTDGKCTERVVALLKDEIELKHRGSA
ncbi:hypothetical protein [Thalassospira alkalitolerans]|uniref:hypothetical protein n=1 Tax=Thalassospira alkalitolerans TaxID=1293890 RepID=UPI003AA94658